MLVFLDGTYSTYLLGVALSAPSFWLAAPTAADIAHRQHQLHESGCMVDLGAALRDPPTQP